MEYNAYGNDCHAIKTNFMARFLIGCQKTWICGSV